MYKRQCRYNTENIENTVSVIISWIVFNSAAVNVPYPILFAGTCRQYSKKAMPQLAIITIHSGDDLNLKCPYQANVIKTFDAVNKSTGRTYFISTSS